MAHAWRIPSRVTFPWGYVVRVRQVPPSHPELEGSTGVWDVETRTIYLDKTVPARHRRWKFVHELDHARADWFEHHVLPSGKVEPRPQP